MGQNGVNDMNMLLIASRALCELSQTPSNIFALSKSMKVEYSNLYFTVKRLESEGILYRVAGDKETEAMKFHTTPKGSQIAQRLMAIKESLIEGIKPST